MLVVLRYPHREEARKASIQITKANPHSGKIGIALVGAGGFALGVHMPNLAKLKDRYELKTVKSRTGASAVMAAVRPAPQGDDGFRRGYQRSAGRCRLDRDATRQHAAMALRALRAGKHVLVEKPLAITESQLDEIEAYFREQRDTPVLMTELTVAFHGHSSCGGTTGEAIHADDRKFSCQRGIYSE